MKKVKPQLPELASSESESSGGLLTAYFGGESNSERTGGGGAAAPVFTWSQTGGGDLGGVEGPNFGCHND